MAFVKLDVKLLDSTLWVDPMQTRVFITALLMAEPHEVKEPTAALLPDRIEPSGFIVPPGWYGFVRAAGVGILGRAKIDDRDAGMAALRALGEPDHESRTPDYEGRRMVRIGGGYIVLNWEKYRERDLTTAERSKRWRERVKEKATRRDDTVTRRDDTVRNGSDTEERRESSELESSDVPEEIARRTRQSRREAVKPESVSDEVWADWLAHRRSLKVTTSQTALNGVVREAAKAGITIAEALETSIAQGWKGFRADWLASKRNGKPTQQHTGFEKIDYGKTRDL